MARVTLSALLTSIAGRYGGGVFRNWRGTTVLAVLPDSVTNPSTDKQAKSREFLSIASKAWNKASASVRSAWEEVATVLTAQWKDFGNPVGSRSIIMPPRGPYTGLGALTSVCGLLGSVEGWVPPAAIPLAPVGVTAPSAPKLLTVSGTTALGLTVTWRDPVNWGQNQSEGFIRVFAKAENGSSHTQLLGFAIEDEETLTALTLTPAGGGAALPFKQGWYVVQIDAINSAGLRSAPSAIKDFYVPAAV
jgi:hypothetical protein